MLHKQRPCPTFSVQGLPIREQVLGHLGQPAPNCSTTAPTSCLTATTPFENGTLSQRLSGPHRAMQPRHRKALAVDEEGDDSLGVRSLRFAASRRRPCSPCERHPESGAVRAKQGAKRWSGQGPRFAEAGRPAQRLEALARVFCSASVVVYAVEVASLAGLPLLLLDEAEALVEPFLQPPP